MKRARSRCCNSRQFPCPACHHGSLPVPRGGYVRDVKGRVQRGFGRLSLLRPRVDCGQHRRIRTLPLLLARHPLFFRHSLESGIKVRSDDPEARAASQEPLERSSAGVWPWIEWVGTGVGRAGEGEGRGESAPTGNQPTSCRGYEDSASERARRREQERKGGGGRVRGGGKVTVGAIAGVAKVVATFPARNAKPARDRH